MILCQESYYRGDFQALLQDIESAFRLPNIRWIKDATHNRCLIATVDVGELTIVVKRYNIRDFWCFIRRALRRSKAKDCWYKALLLSELGIPTAEPIAVVEQRFGPLRRQSYYITRFVSGKILNKTLEEGLTGQELEKVIKGVADFFKVLKKERIEHRDPRSHNVILNEEKLHFMDLDTLRRYRISRLFQHHHERDIKKFLDSCGNREDIKSLFDKYYL